MERTKTRGPDGKQRSEYAEKYYLRNRKRIAERDRKRRQRIKSDPILRAKYRRISTEATRRWRARYPERVKESRRKQYLSRKIRALRMIGDLKCHKCGCDDIKFLEVNHKNGGGSREWRENSKQQTLERVLSGKRKVDDLEILCRVCNALDFLARKDEGSSRRFKVEWK